MDHHHASMIHLVNIKQVEVDTVQVIASIVQLMADSNQVKVILVQVMLNTVKVRVHNAGAVDVDNQLRSYIN